MSYECYTFVILFYCYSLHETTERAPFEQFNSSLGTTESNEVYLHVVLHFALYFRMPFAMHSPSERTFPNCAYVQSTRQPTSCESQNTVIELSLQCPKFDLATKELTT